MSSFLRIEMLILAFAVMLIVFHAIIRRRLSVRFSLIWLAISVSMVLVAAFPKIADLLCSVTHIKTPSNLIYLLGILALLLLVFQQTEIISQQAEQIKKLVQYVSLEKYLTDEKSQKDEP